MANKVKSYTEGEILKTFNLTRLTGNAAYPLMAEWTSTSTELDELDERIFNKIYANLLKNIVGWQEEELKMQFITYVLMLGRIEDTEHYANFFERTIDATVDGYYLKTKTDFMLAKGAYGIHEAPYFHFQEYKPFKNPSGDSMGQLLEALLIAQQKNNNGKPMYGCEIIGKYWNFVILQNRTYCVSDSYDCTKKADLMQIIAILRKFKYILDTELIDK